MNKILATCVLGTVLFFSSVLVAGEKDTTWRTGDLIQIMWVCKEADVPLNALLIEQRSGDKSNRSFTMALKQGGNCGQLPFPITTPLGKWMGGNIKDPHGNFFSVWEVKDQDGNAFYTTHPDEGGSHNKISAPI